LNGEPEQGADEAVKNPARGPSQKVGDATGASARLMNRPPRDADCFVEFKVEKFPRRVGSVGGEMVVEHRLREMAIDRLTPPDDFEGRRHSGPTGNFGSTLVRVSLCPPDLEMGLREGRVLEDVDISGIHGAGERAGITITSISGVHQPIAGACRSEFSRIPLC